MSSLHRVGAVTLLMFVSSLPVFAGEGSASLPRSSPEHQGISSTAVLGFVEAADRQLDSLHSFMLVRHGTVVAEGWWSPYNAESRHELYSLSKSFTSTAVGIAIGEGKLSLDDSVLAAFKDQGPSEPSEFLKAMRLRDLLRMSTGHQKEPASSPDAISPKSFLAQPVPFKPGTHFLYNTPATFMASAMVQKATGQTVLDYLTPRLFEPLGIKNPTWTTNSQGVSLGGYGLSVRTEDIAKFGQLYLQKGNWHGKQLVPATWVEEATARQTSNGSNPRSDWEQGYGYQFWRCRNGAYRGDGAFGQYCIVLPEQDAVIVFTSGLKDMQAVLNLVWEKLLPALQPKPLAEDVEGKGRLQSKLAALTIHKPQGAATSPQLSKRAGKTYQFATNDRKLESLTIEAGEKPGDLSLILKIDGKVQHIEFKGANWHRGKFSPTGAGELPVASTCAWSSEDTLSAKVVMYETPFVLNLRLKFEGEELQYESDSNVRGASPKLVGRVRQP